MLHLNRAIFLCSQVYLTVNECDEEIIEYAQKNDSFAILSQDTDFIISDLNAVALSVKNLNINAMTTVLYDRVKLAKRLNIEVCQLPLLAILAGNDMVPFESLKVSIGVLNVCHELHYRKIIWCERSFSLVYAYCYCFPLDQGYDKSVGRMLIFL